jgi:hypothetical protein
MGLAFLTDIPRSPGLKPDEIAARWNAYRQYLASIQDRLLAGARTYATSDWHMDHQHSRSPHDAWVESVVIQEPARGDRKEARAIEIVIELLASSHDGRIRFTYTQVRSYALGVPPEFEMPPLNVGHGDWLVDEVRLSDRGLIVHEILLSRGSLWAIEATDLRYEWLPLTER